MMTFLDVTVVVERLLLSSFDLSVVVVDSRLKIAAFFCSILVQMECPLKSCRFCLTENFFCF